MSTATRTNRSMKGARGSLPPPWARHAPPPPAPTEDDSQERRGCKKPSVSKGNADCQQKISFVQLYREACEQARANAAAGGGTGDAAPRPRPAARVVCELPYAAPPRVYYY
ncbi:hypothetical protein O0L34_g11686 [Tuta absoluta]|nr:hypothetical protein O0L34_g11686 [Tuta absoluta]